MRGGRGATWRSRRGKERTRAWGLALGPKLVELGGWSGGGSRGKRKGRVGRTKSQIWGITGMRARLGQGARGEIPQGWNRARLRRRFPSRVRPPSPSHDPSERAVVQAVGESL